MPRSYCAGGKFFNALPVAAQPLFGVKGCWTLNHMTFVVLSCLSTAFLAHFNAPTFYKELKGRSMKVKHILFYFNFPLCSCTLFLYIDPSIT